ncbi:bifunctional acetate--CoA ligase family protein/GNAT family N-acetyltransferase [Noviherbaspirillum denitrificans]|uniref:GCN5 family acetyltransferase n=1 Tax=Noviherbaspirillum denitrificans TaxID=1968433 RepID=A0A254TBC7_9BURK|nr:bifunctional acetate--CoA ligase family protein/GNAT family N-acetyltransferase [Noviherbaspirillum denitrificans]OWW19457.1 GCN5 family acetyltransferase [Noviherbaspirillum denitrificans]
MTVRNLKHLFEPKSIALIGASPRPGSVGVTVLKNLLAGGFEGEIMLVNPKYDTLAERPVYASVAKLPAVPDLAVICTPPSTVPGIISDLGKRGTRAAIVLTPGLAAAKDLMGRNMRDLMLKAARPHLLRILGPNSVGMLVPRLGLNASFAHTGALPGKVAFVSQSGAMSTGVLDWAKARNIGFSKFISLGEKADIDVGDVLDYLAGDYDTQAILLYLEAIRDARKFMSAARAAARSKPIIVIKAGRAPEGAKAAASHTGALAGSDDVYDAAIRRAGMLRVYTTLDLFDAVETLAHSRPLRGDRLAIISNGGGPGVLATDALIGKQGRLADLPAQAIEKLGKVLPSCWSHGNPVDILGDAPAQRYIDAMEIVTHEPDVDAALLIHAPNAMVSSEELANALVPAVKNASRNVLSCWLGGEEVARARAVFSNAGIPTYDTPEEAARGFMQIVQYNRNQKLLMEVPASASGSVEEDREAVRAMVKKALSLGRDTLTEPEAKQVLAAYGIPVVRTLAASSIEEAVTCAERIGYPVALKILSPDVVHKSDVGGVVLDLEDADSVRTAAMAMNRRLAGMQPGASLSGFSVQSMVRRPEARELIVGVATDPVFGPVILFGQGGIAVEVTADHAIGLPPLNTVLARDMISRTRVSSLLAAYRNRAAADTDAICRTLIQISHLVIDIPEIMELDINPLLADADGVIALDARIRIRATEKGGMDRLAIRPYPEELEEWVDWQGGKLLLRPIKPEDGQQHVEFFASLTPEDVRMRMFVHMRELSPGQLARMTQIDYDREMAFIATRMRADGTPETLGVARIVFDPDNIQGEFAVTVRSDMKGKGLGRLLMQKLIRHSRERGAHEIVGETLSQNQALLGLVKPLGFSANRSRENDTYLLKLPLKQN